MMPSILILLWLIQADIAGPQPTEGPDVNGTAAPSGGVLLKHDHSPSADFRPPKRFKPAPPEDDSDDDRDVSGAGVW